MLARIQVLQKIRIALDRELTPDRSGIMALAGRREGLKPVRGARGRGTVMSYGTGMNGRLPG